MKQNIRILAVAALLITLSLVVFSAEAQDLSWGGNAELTLAKSSFTDNEPITGTITFYNTQDYPLVGGNAVIQLAQGSYEYPSQTSSNDNIIFEQVVPFNWILPKSSKTVSFSIPKQNSGNYRVELYSWVVKSKYIGASNILYNPISKEVTVSGNSSKIRAKINRELSIFKGFMGPVGFPTKPSEGISGEVMVMNPSSVDKTGLKLGVTVCDWAEVFCSSENETLFDIPTIQANSNSVVSVKLNAPSTPSAYLINMKVYDGSEVDSIYKNRAIVLGGTAKIRKIYIDGLASKKYSINALISGSPDHFTYPDFNNFTINLTVFDNNNKIEEQTKQVASIKAGEILEQNFSINSKQLTSICMSINSQAKTFENECFEIPLKEIQNEYDLSSPKLVDVNWVYDESTNTLTFSLKKEKINSFVRLFFTEKTLYSESISEGSSFEKSIIVPKEDLLLSVDDLDAKEQQLFTLNFSLPVEKREVAQVAEDPTVKEQTEKPICTGKICENNFTCTLATIDSLQGACCTGECTPLPLEENNSQVPLIIWVALMFGVIAIIVVVNSIRQVKKQ
jgi:hypothetical protein